MYFKRLFLKYDLIYIQNCKIKWGAIDILFESECQIVQLGKQSRNVMAVQTLIFYYVHFIYIGI